MIWPQNYRCIIQGYKIGKCEKSNFANASQVVFESAYVESSLCVEKLEKIIAGEPCVQHYVAATVRAAVDIAKSESRNTNLNNRKHITQEN